LRLEANPIARKLRWRFGLATLLVCFLPYYHVGFAYTLLVTSLLVSASNARGIWLARSLGEERYLAQLQEAAARSSVAPAVGWTLLTASFWVLLGALMWLLSQGDRDWARYTALGIWIYALVVALYGSLFLVRLVRQARDGVQRVSEVSSEPS
jgi:hypothetical protein